MADPVDPTSLTAEELTQLQEKAQKAEEMTKQLEEKEKELSNLREKDLNMSRFRHKSEEEKKSILAKMTETERRLTLEHEETAKELETERTERMEEAKESLLNRLVGTNADARKKIEMEVKDLYSASGEAKTPKELAERYTKGWKVYVASQKTSNPLYSFAPTNSYNEPRISETPFAETDSGKATYKRLFGHEPGTLGKK